MAVKHKLTKAEYDALSDAVKALYKADGDSFLLDTEGVDDVGELRRAHDREKAASKAEKARADKAEQDLRDQRDAAARNTGDIASLEKSWKDKVDAAEKSGKDREKQLTKQLTDALVTTTATSIAAELGGDAAELLLPHITGRLQLEFDGDKAITRVLDKEGHKSALTIVELKKEIAEDKRFAKIVIASKASGGGAAGGNRQPNGGAGGGQGDKKFKDLNNTERTEWYNRDKVGFLAASEASAKEEKEARSRPLARTM